MPRVVFQGQMCLSNGLPMMNKQFEAKHFAILAGFLVALGAQLGGLEHGWSDAMTPGFIGGLIGQVGTLIVAIFVGAPRGPWNGDERRTHDVDVWAPKDPA